MTIVIFERLGMRCFLDEASMADNKLIINHRDKAKHMETIASKRWANKCGSRKDNTGITWSYVTMKEHTPSRVRKPLDVALSLLARVTRPCSPCGAPTYLHVIIPRQTIFQSDPIRVHPPRCRLSTQIELHLGESYCRWG